MTLFNHLPRRIRMKISPKQWMRENHSDIVRILQLVRYEADAWIAHFWGKISFRQRATLRRLRHTPDLMVNIASGSEKATGWVTIDVSSHADIRVDLRRPLPLTDDSVALLFCEHFCDHLSFPFAITKFLAECRRILRPGGRARFVLHDAEDLLRAYLDKDAGYFDLALETKPTMIEAVNKLFRYNGFHQFLYDYETFEKLLREVGFSKIIRCKFRRSEIPQLVLDVDHPSREVMSMYVEAIK